MTSLRRVLAASAALALGLAGGLAIASPAAATGCEVTSTADDGTDGTLRYAIVTADCAVVTFGPLFDTPQTINLTNGLQTILIDHPVTLQGPGADLLTIQRENNAFVYALFQVLLPPNAVGAIDVTINDLTMDKDAGDSATVLGTAFVATAGSGLGNLSMTNVMIRNQDSQNDGGAIWVAEMSGAAIFDHLTVQDNTAASDGGAVYLAGASSVTVSNSSVLRNEAFGFNSGGMYFANLSGILSITGTTFQDNTAQHGGALRFEDVGTVNIDASTFDHNIASDSGGALGLGMTGGYGAVTITGSTFIRNESQNGYGGAIFTDGSFDSPFTIARSTFDDNSATSEDEDGAFGGAIYINEVDEPFTIDSSTFTRNTTNGTGTSVYASRIEEGVEALLFIVNSTFDEDLTAGSGDSVIHVNENSGAFSIKYSTLVGFEPVRVGDSPGSEAVASTIVQSGVGQSDLFGEDDPFQVQYSILSKAIEPLNVSDLGNNQFSTLAQLGPLQNNGGPTETRMPASNGPAVAKGGPTLGAPLFDQRFTGFPRIVGVLDVGAVEIPAALPNTGSTGLPTWVPIVGGIVLLLGIAAVVFSVMNRRKSGGAVESESAAESGPGTGGDALFPEASTAPPTAEPPAENDPR